MAMEHLRWRPTVNERDFIERALQSDLRVDGRHSFDFRKLKVTFGRYIRLPPTYLAIPGSLPLLWVEIRPRPSLAAAIRSRCRRGFVLLCSGAWQFGRLFGE
jgi:hypothetical protein